MSPATPIKSAPSSSIFSQLSSAGSQINRTQQLMLLTFGMVLATVGIGFTMIQLPWQERRQQLASRYNEEKERSELLLAIQRQRTDLQKVEEDYLLKGGAPSLGSQVSNLATQSGLQIDSVTPQPELPADPYTHFQLEILATGNLPNLLRFLRAIEDHRPLFWVEHLDMGEPPVENLSFNDNFDEKAVFQPKETQRIRLLIGAIARQKGSG